MTLLNTPARLLLAACVLHASAYADELQVPSQFPTVQAALDAAMPGDEIVLAPGTYRESLIAPATGDVTIRSSDPYDLDVVNTTILSGDLDDDGIGDSRILTITDIPEDSTFTVDGLTFTDGYSDQEGGAIYFASFEASLEIHRSNFVRNRAALEGGAVSTTWRTYAVITESTFRHNTSPLTGGAVYAKGDLYQVYNCAFLGNRSGFGALSPCGSFFSGAAMPADVVGCTFVGNTSDEVGAIGFCGRTGRVINCTFSENYSGTLESSAAGRYFSLSVSGSIVGGFITVTNSIVDIQRTQLPFNTGITVNDSIALPFWPGERTAIADPLFVRRPSDGGDGWGDDPATPGIDESLNDDFGDLRLMPGSPAIDIGDSNLSLPDIFDLDRDGDTAEPMPVDLDLNDRHVDDPATTNMGMGPFVYLDLGAYEFVPASCLPDVNSDGMLTPADFTAWVAAYNAMLPAADQNQDGQITPADFTAWVANYNIGC